MFRSLSFKPEYMFLILIYGLRYRKKRAKKYCISSRSFRTCVYSSKLICFDFWQIGFLRKRLKWNGVATHTKEKCTRVCACVKESEREIYSWISEEIIVLHFLPLYAKCCHRLDLRSEMIIFSYHFWCDHHFLGSWS